MRLVCLLWFALLPAFAFAQETEVDLELFLAVDVSRSMQPFELEIQRRGYAEALASPEVAEAIAGGPLGRIALTYVEWAGAYSQRTVVPWSLIESAEDAQAFAAKITAHYDNAMRRTSISSALLYAADDMEVNGFKGLRRVIDVSGDGPNNMGPPVTEARDRVLARGVIINGLPLMTRDALSDRWGIPDLDRYYEACVIGGPGAFALPVDDWTLFAEAVRRKLVLEIAGAPTRIRLVAGYDCLVGEKIWERYQAIISEP